MKLHKLILLRKPGGFLAPTIRAIIKNTINKAKEKRASPYPHSAGRNSPGLLL
jgi:hypothetical protein